MARVVDVIFEVCVAVFLILSCRRPVYLHSNSSDGLLESVVMPSEEEAQAGRYFDLGTGCLEDGCFGFESFCLALFLYQKAFSVCFWFLWLCSSYCTGFLADGHHFI